MKFIKKVPMAISGLALAIAALGNLLLPYGEGIRYFCGILSSIVLCFFILKLIFDTKGVWEDLKNPAIHCVTPTFTMVLMILCSYVQPYLGNMVVYLWLGALFLQVLIILLFIKRHIFDFKLQNVFPGWFVSGVGIVVASVTGPVMGMRALGQVIFWIGFSIYFALLPVFIYRMIKIRPLPEPVRPQLAILIAPMSLCTVGYFSAFEQNNALLVFFMQGLLIITYLYVLANMTSLLRLPFSPAYVAYTFPFVIGATAFSVFNRFLVNEGYYFFSIVPGITLFLAIIFISYVFVRYTIFLTIQFKNS